MFSHGRSGGELTRQTLAALTSDETCNCNARAYHLLQKLDLGHERGSERGPLLEFNIGFHPGDSTHYVNAKDILSLSLLQARLIDLGLPIKIVEDT